MTRNITITAKSITNMVMGNNNGGNNFYSENTISSTTIAPLVVDAKILVDQTQDRMWQALEGGSVYD